jgi:hypothetical protein
MLDDVRHVTVPHITAVDECGKGVHAQRRAKPDDGSQPSPRASTTSGDGSERCHHR